MPVAPYNPRNTDESLDIEYRIEDQIKGHSDSVHLSERWLDDTNRKRSRIETAIGVCKDLGLGTPQVRGRVRVQSHVFLTLSLRVVVALASHERDNDVASSTITL